MNTFAARAIEELDAMYGLGMISGRAHEAAVAYVEVHESDFDATLSSTEAADSALELSAEGLPARRGVKGDSVG